MKRFFSHAAIGFGVSLFIVSIIGYAIEGSGGYNQYGGTDGFAVIAWIVMIGGATGGGMYGWMKQERKTFSDVAAAPISRARQFHDSVSEKVGRNDAEYYAIAEEEIESGKLDKALWSQALVNVKGDESRRKVEYMELRAKQLRRKK